MKRVIKLVTMLVLAAVLLAGCGDSGADGGKAGDSKEESKKGTNSTNGTNGKDSLDPNCYDLSKMSVDEIVGEIERILTADPKGKTAKAYVEALKFPVKPMTPGELFEGDNKEDVSFTFEKVDNIGGVDFSFRKNDDGTIAEVSHIYLKLTIFGKARAEEVYDKLAGKFFAESVGTSKDKREEQRLSITEGTNEMIMHPHGIYEDAYSFSMSMDRK